VVTKGSAAEKGAVFSCLILVPLENFLLNFPSFCLERSNIVAKKRSFYI